MPMQQMSPILVLKTLNIQLPLTQTNLKTFLGNNAHCPKINNINYEIKILNKIHNTKAC
jgi:hypothetical protein